MGELYTRLLSLLATQTFPDRDFSFRGFSVAKEEGNLPPFFSEEALPRNLAWMSCHLSSVQVQSNLRENRCTCSRQTSDSLAHHLWGRIRY